MREFKVTASVDSKPAQDFIVRAETDVDAIDSVLAENQGDTIEIFTVCQLS